MAKEIKLEWLRKLPHLDVDNLQGRSVPLHALHDGNKWNFWFPANDGLRCIGVTPHESFYFADTAVGDGDLHVAFLEFLHQHVSWPDVMHLANGLYSDLQNAGASLSKLKLIYDYADSASLDHARMVATEIEYVFLTCRSMFDLLQEIMVRLWDRVRLTDTAARKVNLPKSYRKMVLRDECPMSAQSIAQRFVLPVDIAAIYASSAPFFAWLRSYRNLISHSGHSITYVFHTERGFAISKAEKPFSEMNIWSATNSLPNDLGSALAVLAHVLATTFSTCDAFAAALPNVIKFPPAIAPKHRLFVCGPHLRHLVRLDRLITENPWYNDPTPRASDDGAH